MLPHLDTPPARTLSQSSVQENPRAQDKVLPEAFTQDPDRLARFEREAKVLASLNHPNIGHIYGLEESEGIRALVLELVEGPTLADRIKQGPIPLDEALPIAKQLAAALEAAHEKGVVHRDLKPANIKVTPAGNVKVLDFGLAKAFTPEMSPGHASQLSTVTAEATLPGVILGTAAYMSPEQARGTAIDRRSDIWAFGCCVYEILTGKAVFRGGTLSDTIAAVIERTPDWDALPRSTPPPVRDLLRRCLQKDPKQRLHDIADARIVVDDSLTDAPPGYTPSGRQIMKWAAFALAVLTAGVVVYRLPTRETPLPRLANPVQVTAVIGLEDYPTWSPDGRTVAYESNQAGDWDIWVSQIGGGAVNRTADHPGTDRYASWSPSGAQIAFWSERDGGGYYVMPAVGGSATRLASTPVVDYAYHSPPVWSQDGTELAYVQYEIVESALVPSFEIVDTVTRQTRRVSLPGAQETRLDLSWTRDGRYIAYVDAAQQFAETTQLFVLRLRDGESIAVTDAGFNVRSPRWSLDGRALYYTANRIGAADLWLQRMDDDGRPTGDPQQITAGLEMMNADFSADGTRVSYARGRWVANVWRVPVLEDRPATWDDAEQITFDQAFVEFLDVSPDGRHVVFNSDRSGNQDLWRMPLGGGEAVRLTTDPAPEWGPRWSPDGEQVVFYSYRTGNREIWVMPAEGGPARQITADGGYNVTPQWSPDGREVAFTSLREGSNDVWVVSIESGDLRLITPSGASESHGSWSPDGEWITYHSNRNGTAQIWRVPANGGSPELLTRGSGRSPVWAPDGSRVFFRGADEREGNLWSISLTDGNERPATHLAGQRGTLSSTVPATDGQYLYFTWRNDVGDIWVMDVVM